MLQATTTPYLTLGDIARRYGCHTWQVRRCILRGLLSEPARVGVYRVFHANDLPAVEQALRELGYLRGEAPRA